MNQIVNIYKSIGITPYQLIVRLREELPEYKDVKISYAGRLDPLAHGVMLLMIGEANKEREKYLQLSKEYEFEVVFGLATDTYDLMGMLQNKFEARTTKSETTPNDRNIKDQNASELERFAESKLGKHVQPYPPFSSKTVDGVSLHELAKQDKIADIKIPTKDIEIYRFDLLAQGEIASQDLQKHIVDAVGRVEGDFRQVEILERWDAFFRTHPDEVFKTARFSITCSSGTYVRSLVNALGLQLGVGAVTLEILRTKVGEYGLEDSLKLKH
jgi:tRNA pseudouridine55 synthase